MVTTENSNQRKAELTRKVDLPEQIYSQFKSRAARVLSDIKNPMDFFICDKTRAARVLNELKYSIAVFNSCFGQS